MKEENNPTLTTSAKEGHAISYVEVPESDGPISALSPMTPGYLAEFEALADKWKQISEGCNRSSELANYHIYSSFEQELRAVIERMKGNDNGLQ